MYTTNDPTTSLVDKPYSFGYHSKDINEPLTIRILCTTQYILKIPIPENKYSLNTKTTEYLTPQQILFLKII